MKLHNVVKELRGLLIVAAIIFPFRSSIADWNDVPTGSMIPTILEGDRIAVNKLAYDFKIPFTTQHIVTWDNPHRGDIVVLYAPDSGTRLVKRVIGLPGDTLVLRDNRLSINGVAVDYTTQAVPNMANDFIFAIEQLGQHPHIVQWSPFAMGAPRSVPTFHIPLGQYFMMGDNRDNSRDSRSFGFVPRDQIIGRAYAVALSLDPAHRYAPRWGRFFTALN